MNVLTQLRRFIIGRRVFILSHLQFKRIILTGQMAIIVLTLSTAYAVFDIIHGVYVSWPYQAACSLLALSSFILNRQGMHTAAKVVLILATNFTRLCLCRQREYSYRTRRFLYHNRYRNYCWLRLRTKEPGNSFRSTDLNGIPRFYLHRLQAHPGSRL